MLCGYCALPKHIFFLFCCTHAFGSFHASVSLYSPLVLLCFYLPCLPTIPKTQHIQIYIHSSYSVSTYTNLPTITVLLCIWTGSILYLLFFLPWFSFNIVHKFVQHIFCAACCCHFGLHFMHATRLLYFSGFCLPRALCCTRLLRTCARRLCPAGYPLFSVSAATSSACLLSWTLPTHPLSWPFSVHLCQFIILSLYLPLSLLSLVWFTHSLHHTWHAPSPHHLSVHS